MTLTARPPSLVSLYFVIMSMPVWRMVSMTVSSETTCDAVAVQREARGRHGRRRGDGVALDARHLHEPAHGVAREAEVVLHRDLGGVLDLAGGAAEHGAERPAAIAHAEPTSAWQPPSAPEIDAFFLTSDADRGGGEQEAADAGGIRTGHEPQVVVADRGDDARGAVRGRGDDAAARRVLLVDGERERVQPLGRGVAQVLVAVVLLEAAGAPRAARRLTPQAARQRALGREPVRRRTRPSPPRSRRARASMPCSPCTATSLRRATSQNETPCSSQSASSSVGVRVGQRMPQRLGLLGRARRRGG